MTVIEIMVVLGILTLSVAIFAQTIAAASRLDPVARETMLATEGARVMLERMRAVPFAEVFQTYNDCAADDPGGAGTAPGHQFAIEGLSPFGVAGAVGTIGFPGSGCELREDVVDERLSMPRDLNGDGLVDAANHAASKVIVPVRIRLEWASRSGQGGKRTMEVYAIFSSL